jgi:hypothetical protein
MDWSLSMLENREWFSRQVKSSINYPVHNAQPPDLLRTPWLCTGMLVSGLGT